MLKLKREILISLYYLMATWDELAGLVRAHLAAGKGAGAAGRAGAGVTRARRVEEFPAYFGRLRWNWSCQTRRIASSSMAP